MKDVFGKNLEQFVTFVNVPTKNEMVGIMWIFAALRVGVTSLVEGGWSGKEW